MAASNDHLSMKNRQRLFNLLAGPARPNEAICTSVPLGKHQLRVRFQLNDALSELWYYFGYSGYERGVTRLLQQLVPKQHCIIEAGANIGYFSLLMAALMERGGQIHVFEPEPELYDELTASASLNNLPALVLNRVALTDHEGTSILYVPESRPDRSGRTNASLIPGFMPNTRPVTVPSTRLDVYCQANGMTPDLVKIDAEGAEPAILRGMGNLLLGRPDLIIEILEPFADEIAGILAPLSYRPYLIEDGGLRPVERIVADPHCRDYYFTVHQAHGLTVI